MRNFSLTIFSASDNDLIPDPIIEGIALTAVTKLDKDEVSIEAD